MPSLITIFRDIPDSRVGHARAMNASTFRRYSGDRACGFGPGAESCADLAEFAEGRKLPLRDFLNLENGLPHLDRFSRVVGSSGSRVFGLPDPQAFGRAFETFLTDIGADAPRVIAIDGKTLRRPFGRAAGPNKIAAAPALLATLALDGALVRGDAIPARAAGNLHHHRCRTWPDRDPPSPHDPFPGLALRRPGRTRSARRCLSSPPSGPGAVQPRATAAPPWPASSQPATRLRLPPAMISPPPGSRPRASPIHHRPDAIAVPRDPQNGCLSRGMG